MGACLDPLPSIPFWLFSHAEMVFIPIPSRSRVAIPSFIPIPVKFMYQIPILSHKNSCTS